MGRSEATSEAEGQDRTAAAATLAVSRETGDSMSAVCSICRREDRPAIEQAHVEGLSLRAIAKLHPGTTAWSLRRHFQHVPEIIEEQTNFRSARSRTIAQPEDFPRAWKN